MAPTKKIKLDVGNLNLPILPEEVWLEIFSNLSYNDLRSASLVSKSWNVWIGSFQPFIGNTRLNFPAETSSRAPIDGRLKILESLQRKYRAVRINTAAHGVLIKALSFHQTNLTQLELSRSTLNASQFLQIFKQSPAIKALSLESIVIKKKVSRREPVQLKLTDLAFCLEDDGSSMWMLDHLHCTEVTNYLRIKSPEDEEGSRTYYSKCTIESVVKFLGRLEGTVKTIDLCSFEICGTIRMQFPAFSFKWETLILRGIYEMQSSYRMERLCAASGENSVLKVATDYIYKGAASRILNGCVNTKSYELLEFEGPIIRPCDYSTSTMEKVENLTYRLTGSQRWYALDFWDFPNLKNLTIDGSMLSLPYARHLSELKSITLHGFDKMAEDPESTTETLKKWIVDWTKIEKVTFVIDRSIEITSSYRDKIAEFLEIIWQSIGDSVDSIIVAHQQLSSLTELTSYDPETRSLMDFKETLKIVAAKSNDE